MIPSIDTHVHAWNLEKAEYDWLKGNTSILNRTWSLDELEPQLNSNKVGFGVMVQAANNLEDTSSMLEECQNRSWLLGAVGWLPLDDEALLPEDTRLLKKNPWFKGVRHLIHDEPNPRWLLRPEVVAGFKILSEESIPFDVVAVLPDHLDCVMRLSEKYPEQRWCIDHLGHPPAAKKERWGKWGEWMKLLAGNPNVFIKISGLGMCTADLSHWDSEEIRPYIDYSLEQFGTSRAMLGGDWPVVELCGGYSKSWEYYQNILSQALAPAEMERIQYRNAVEFYRLEW